MKVLFIGGPDNRKIRRLMPEYRATTPLAEGIGRTLAWFNADTARQLVDVPYDAMCDRLIDAYERGLKQALQELSRMHGNAARIRMESPQGAGAFRRLVGCSFGR